MPPKRDKRVIKPTFKDTEFGRLFEASDTLKYEKIYNYEYTYFVKTPNGMREDIESNHKYGNERDGYEQWKSENHDFDISYSGVTSVREITTKGTDIVVGYMFERKLPNKIWLEEIDKNLDKAWELFCNELDVNDAEALKYYLFSGVSQNFRDDGADRIQKFRIMEECIDTYNDPDELDYKNLIDKIKG